MTSLEGREDAEAIVLELPNDASLSVATPLAETLRDALSRGKPIVIQADAVERVSTACIQVLVAASRTEGAKPLVIRDPSEAMVETCAILGLGDWLRQGSGA